MAQRATHHCARVRPLTLRLVVQRLTRHSRPFCLCTVAVLAGASLSASGMHQRSSAPVQTFLSPRRDPAGLHRQECSDRIRRRQLLPGFLGVASCHVEQEARADIFSGPPIAFDYRKLEELDPSKRTIVGDRGSAEVVSAVAKLQKARADAVKAKETLKANPIANVGSLFGLTSAADAGDSILEAFKGGIKGANIEGPYAAAAREQRNACSAIGSIMDEQTRSSTDRGCRLAITAWYSFVMDKDVRPLTFASPAGEIAAQISRKRPSVQEKLAQKIDAYVAALDKLLKFVE